MDIGANIKAIRESKGIKQIKVADFLEMDYSAYAKLEKRGNKITFELLEKVAQALDVPITELIEKKNENAFDNDRIKKLEDKIGELENVIYEKVEFIRRKEFMDKSETEEIFGAIIKDMFIIATETGKLKHLEIEEFPFFALQYDNTPLKEAISNFVTKFSMDFHNLQTAMSNVSFQAIGRSAYWDFQIEYFYDFLPDSVRKKIEKYCKKNNLPLWEAVQTLT